MIICGHSVGYQWFLMVMVHQATVNVSDLGDIRTLKIEPKHGISGIYAR